MLQFSTMFSLTSVPTNKLQLFHTHVTPYKYPRLDSRNEPKFSNCYDIIMPRGYKTWVHSQIQNKVQWLAVRKQPIIALCCEFETVLKFYNLEAMIRDIENPFLNYQKADSDQPVLSVPVESISFIFDLINAHDLTSTLLMFILRCWCCIFLWVLIINMAWKSLWIQTTWLHQKSSGLGLHCFKNGKRIYEKVLHIMWSLERIRYDVWDWLPSSKSITQT